MENLKDIVFPSEKTRLLLSEILEKHNLSETSDEIMEKIKAKKISATTTLVFVVKKIATGEINISMAIEKLQSDLNLSPETAKKIVDELNNRVVSLGKERAIFEKEKAGAQKEPLPQKEKTINPYREPIE